MYFISNTIKTEKKVIQNILNSEAFVKYYSHKHNKSYNLLHTKEYIFNWNCYVNRTFFQKLTVCNWSGKKKNILSLRKKEKN